jgi:hypothetical protein
LKQNYPNPFNPSTTIEFAIGSSSYVIADIFNSMGEKVISLLNGYKDAGLHSIDFNGDNLPSGIYFLRLQAGNNTKTIKMSLLK